MIDSDSAAGEDQTLVSPRDTLHHNLRKVARGSSAGRKTPRRGTALGGARSPEAFVDRAIPIPITRDADYRTLMRFLQMAPIGLAETSIDGAIERLNPLGAQLLLPLTQGNDIRNIFEAFTVVAPELRERAENFHAAHGMICEDYQIQVGQAVQGEHDALVLSLTLLKLDREHLMAVISDISVSVQRDRDLRESQAWVNTMVTGISDYATVLLDERGIIQSWNATIARVTGFTAEQVRGQPYDMFYQADTITAHASNDRLQDADLHGWTLDEGWRRRADGSKFWGSCLIAPLAATDAARPKAHGYSLIVRDISERKEVNEALRRSVSYDHLTGLANRRAFFEAAEAEMERWERTRSPLALMVIDADHFKTVNDTFGHHAGDAVLRHLAAGIAAASRTMDFVARFGGEEFVVMMPSTSIDGAAVVARRLLKSVAAQVVEVDGQLIRYSVSAGIAVMEHGMSGFDTLMKRADRALYAAKHNGRNRVERWDATMSDSYAPQLIL